MICSRMTISRGFIMPHCIIIEYSWVIFGTYTMAQYTQGSYNRERTVYVMLIMAWVFMGVAILSTVLLLSDLKREMKYNRKNRGNEFSLMVAEGDHNGLQETDNRQNRVVLRRCC